MKKILSVWMLVCLASIAYSQNCNTIQREYQPSRGIVVLRSPTDTPISFTKVIDTEAQDTTFYASFFVRSAIAGSPSNGISLVLTNGKKLICTEEKTNTGYMSRSPAPNMFIAVSRETMKQLASTPIKTFNLYSYSQTLTDAEQQNLRQLSYCLNYGTQRQP